MCYQIHVDAAQDDYAHDVNPCLLIAFFLVYLMKQPVKFRSPNIKLLMVVCNKPEKSAMSGNHH